MKRALIAGLLAGAGVSAAAATVSGTVLNQAGFALPNATVELLNPDHSVAQAASSDVRGSFAFAKLPAGDYVLRIQKPGFAALYREFHLDEESEVQRGLTLRPDAAETAADLSVANGARAAAPLPEEPNRLRVGGAFEQAKLIHKVNPLYPPAAKANRIQGVVRLEADISKDGVPEDVRVLESPDDQLSQSALDAVRQWRYQQTMLNGAPVPVVTEIRVTYTLLP